MTSRHTMKPLIPESALVALEAQVDAALAGGGVEDLQILGYGEISIVLAWQGREGSFACKRMPPFHAEGDLRAYRVLLGEYLEALEARGILPLETAVQSVIRPDGALAVYCVQPALEGATLGPRLLKERATEDALDFLGAVLRAISRGIAPSLGVDAQISNWALRGGDLVYLDVSTPLLRDHRGRERLDTRLFAASLPWALRGPVLWFMLDDILGKYYDPRRAVLDLMGNLIKEGLGSLLPEAIALANGLCGYPRAFTAREVERYYAFDARMWASLQWLRRMDRWWQTRVRRRAYPFLLPEQISRQM